MNKAIDDWLRVENKVANYREIADEYLDVANDQRPPPNLRPAKPDDLVTDAIIWYPNGAPHYW